MKQIDKANDFLMAWGHPDAAISMKGAVEIISELKEAYEELEAELENERAEIQRCNAEIGEDQRIIGDLKRRIELLEDAGGHRGPEPESPKTLRDEIAMAALQGLLAKPDDEDASLPSWVKTIEDWGKHLSKTAYIYADAMLEARKK